MYGQTQAPSAAGDGSDVIGNSILLVLTRTESGYDGDSRNSNRGFVDCYAGAHRDLDSHVFPHSHPDTRSLTDGYINTHTHSHTHSDSHP